jgi:16S rRNA (uracil1498-N3)-methyltransferase
MQRHRFYAHPSQRHGSTIRLAAEESHHLAGVLRLAEDARVFVFDGEGLEWECEIRRIAKGEVELEITRQLDDPVESPLDLTLAQALIKGDKLDWVVQKSTELGVSRIVPLITDHSEVRLIGDRAEQRLRRYERISLEALKQCGRRRLVKIVEPITLADFCTGEAANEARGSNLIFSERGGRSLQDIAGHPVNKINLFVASEGGWSKREMEMAQASHFFPVSLGPRILRTETAAIVAVTLTQSLLGDIK